MVRGDEWLSIAGEGECYVLRLGPEFGLLSEGVLDLCFAPSGIEGHHNIIFREVAPREIAGIDN